MVASCAATLHECIQTAKIAQSAADQCTLLTTSLAASLAIHSQHIAHATATFSELGIGAAIAILFDPLRWKEHVNKLRTDPIAREDLLSRASMLGWFVRFMIRLLTYPAWRIVGFYVGPIIIIILGIVSLLGMAGFIPMMANENLCFWFGFTSFVMTTITAFVLNVGARERAVNTKIEGLHIP